jgi:hypothetical protein
MYLVVVLNDLALPSEFNPCSFQPLMLLEWIVEIICIGLVFPCDAQHIFGMTELHFTFFVFCWELLHLLREPLLLLIVSQTLMLFWSKAWLGEHCSVFVIVNTAPGQCQCYMASFQCQSASHQLHCSPWSCNCIHRRPAHRINCRNCSLTSKAPWPHPRIGPALESILSSSSF